MDLDCQEVIFARAALLANCTLPNSSQRLRNCIGDTTQHLQWVLAYVSTLEFYVRPSGRRNGIRGRSCARCGTGADVPDGRERIHTALVIIVVSTGGVVSNSTQMSDILYYLTGSLRIVAVILTRK